MARQLQAHLKQVAGGDERRVAAAQRHVRQRVLEQAIEFSRDLGVKAALERDVHLRAGLNVSAGKLTYQAVAEAQGLDWITADEAVAAL